MSYRRLLATALIAAWITAAGAANITTGSGTISGVFVNPSPACAAPVNTTPIVSAECNGIGTGDFTWGYSIGFGTNNNSFSFTGGSFTNVTQGQNFVAGLLYYYNGTSGGGEVDTVHLQLTSSSANPLFNNLVLDEPIMITGTANSNDPIASADFIYFPNHPELGSFRVLEGQSATVQILARFNSLDLAGFGSVVADPNHPDSNPANGFVSSSTSDAPEPSAALLTASSMLFLNWMLVRRRARACFQQS